MPWKDPRPKGPRLRDLFREGSWSSSRRRGNPRRRFRPGGNSPLQNRRCGESLTGGPRGRARRRRPELPSNRRRSDWLPSDPLCADRRDEALLCSNRRRRAWPHAGWRLRDLRPGNLRTSDSLCKDSRGKDRRRLTPRAHPSRRREQISRAGREFRKDVCRCGARWRATAVHQI